MFPRGEDPLPAATAATTTITITTTITAIAAVEAVEEEDECKGRAAARFESAGDSPGTAASERRCIRRRSARALLQFAWGGRERARVWKVRARARALFPIVLRRPRRDFGAPRADRRMDAGERRERASARRAYSGARLRARRKLITSSRGTARGATRRAAPLCSARLLPSVLIRQLRLN